MDQIISRVRKKDIMKKLVRAIALIIDTCGSY
jgi:hypothetical protein